MWPAKKLLRVAIRTIYVVLLIYIGFVAIDFVYEGEINFNIFKNGNYKGVIFAVVGAIVYGLLMAIWYRKKKKS